MAASKIREVMTYLNQQLNTLASIGPGKVFTVVDEADLLSDARLATYPAIGVIYEGMRSNGDGGPSHRMGLSATASFAIVLLTSDKFPVGHDTKLTGLDLLDQIRDLLKDTKGPTGHTWRFEIESPVESRSNKVLVWVQRWSIPIQLH